MLEALRDLYGHQAWADAVHWHVLEGHPGALQDRAILQRLLHLHQVQRAFLTLVEGEALDTSRFGDEQPADEIRAGAVEYHGAARAWLAAASRIMGCASESCARIPLSIATRMCSRLSGEEVRSCGESRARDESSRRSESASGKEVPACADQVARHETTGSWNRRDARCSRA